VRVSRLARKSEPLRSGWAWFWGSSCFLRLPSLSKGGRAGDAKGKGWGWGGGEAQEFVRDKAKGTYSLDWAKEEGGGRSKRRRLLIGSGGVVSVGRLS